MKTSKPMQDGRHVWIASKHRFTTEKFKDAVAKSKSIADVCKTLKLNSGQSVRGAIVDAIENLKIDISHFKKRKSVNPRRSRTVEELYNINKKNLKYIQAYFNSLSPESVKVYTSVYGGFMEFLGERDFLTITRSTVVDYVEHLDDPTSVSNSLQRMQTCLRGMLRYVIRNDIEAAKERVERDTLLFLIE